MSRFGGFRLTPGVLVGALSLGAPLGAQMSAGPDPAQNPLSATLLDLRTQAKHYVTTNINTMPESKYGFRISPQSLTFAAIIGHITDYEYIWCSQAKGEPNPHTGSDEKTVTTKSQAVAGLDSAWAYCDGFFSTMTDQHLSDKVKFSTLGKPDGTPKTELYIMVMTIDHMEEHFGQSLAYMEANGLQFPHAPPKPKAQ
jgi:uncharacterized damage-inducible protein DinB